MSVLPNHSVMPKAYGGLIRAHRLRPIRTEGELDKATAIVNQLAVTEGLSRDQIDYLEVLTGLIEAYENKHHAMAVKGNDPLQVLRFLLAENGMSGSGLGRLLGGPRQLGSAILRGERQLSKAHIRKLSERFHVDASLFLG